MRILVTGGAGFIGSHLVERLSRNGDRVIVLDDFSTASREVVNWVEKLPGVTIVKGSVLDKSLLTRTISGCQQIYHLAAAVGVKLVVEKPLQSFLTNVSGSHNVLELADKKKIPVLLTSSSEVYGKSDKLPFRENEDRVYGSVYNERWGYALSKTSDEFLALAYWRERGLPVVVVRLFNTVGPRQVGTYGMVVPRLVQQGLRNDDLTIYGDGLQIRSFSYVGDVVDGMLKLLNSKKSHGEIFNLGSPEPITILDLAKKIKVLMKSQSKLRMIPYRKVYGETFEDMRVRVPDISKAKRIVGYKPKFTLDDTLKAVIDYYRKSL
ncbi:MAG: GDP-mannose 4,6-dehydratase [Candidatus Harrisonbacteria bacterium]|nr:GDP-mannose 4,6-dehydratase [Candidatus Harrisonbacteria bacterium]